LRQSSGALQTVTAATGVCHELGWNKSCIDVKVGAHCTITWSKCDWSGARVNTNTKPQTTWKTSEAHCKYSI